MPQVSPDRLRVVIDAVLDGLGAADDGAAPARRAHLSRFHFDRLVATGLGEAPGAFRRRLLLERAAWHLRGGARVTDVGLDAGYGSTEAFSRAFRHAYGTPPSRFAGDFRIPAPNGVHFHPPAGLLVPGDPRRTAMDVTDRLLDHDRWHTARLLDAAHGLDDARLDAEIRPGHEVLSFDGPEPTVRAMLDRLVWTKEVWVAAMTGAPAPPGGERSVAALTARHAQAGDAFVDVARDIRARQAWDDAFVDALCDPPQSFTFGAAIAHVLVFSAHRRQVLAGALSDLGVPDAPTNDPIEWERRMAAARPHPAATLRGTAS